MQREWQYVSSSNSSNSSTGHIIAYWFWIYLFTVILYVCTCCIFTHKSHLEAPSSACLLPELVHSFVWHSSLNTQKDQVLLLQTYTMCCVFACICMPTLHYSTHILCIHMYLLAPVFLLQTTLLCSAHSWPLSERVASTLRSLKTWWQSPKRSLPTQRNPMSTLSGRCPGNWAVPCQTSHWPCRSPKHNCRSWTSPLPPALLRQRWHTCVHTHTHTHTHTHSRSRRLHAGNACILYSGKFHDFVIMNQIFAIKNLRFY